jgi:hypothetical protein
VRTLVKIVKSLVKSLSGIVNLWARSLLLYRRNCNKTTGTTEAAVPRFEQKFKQFLCLVKAWAMSRPWRLPIDVSGEA